MAEEKKEGQKIDLNTILPRAITGITIDEHDDERAARLKKENRSAYVEECKGVAVFTCLLLGIIAVGCLAAYEAVFDQAASADTKRWAQTVLSALITGSVAFVIGRKSGTK